MPKFIRKPIEIEAVQWTGQNNVEIKEFCKDCYTFIRDEEPVLMINTLEGVMKATINDYIICGVQGEFYPCKSDIFRAIYQEVTN